MLEELNFEESENWESNELLDDLEGECREVYDHAEQICVKLRWMQCCFAVDHPVQTQLREVYAIVSGAKHYFEGKRYGPKLCALVENVKSEFLVKSEELNRVVELMSFIMSFCDDDLASYCFWVCAVSKRIQFKLKTLSNQQNC